MAQPTAYTVTTDFSEYQSNNSSTPFNGANHDTEFNNIATTLSETLTNLAVIQRDDGLLANLSVHVDALASSVRTLLATSTAFQGDWATSTAYTIGQSVAESSNLYLCTVAHTSGTFATDLAASKWILVGRDVATQEQAEAGTNNTNGMTPLRTKQAINQFVGSGECYFERDSATSVKLSPYNGNRIKINGVSYEIPSAGITLSNGSLSANTHYYIYLYDNSGTLTLEASSTTHATSTASGNVGIEIKSGDATRSLVGAVYTNGSSQFEDDANYAGVISWYNRREKELYSAFTTSRFTSSTTATEINTEIRIQFITWADVPVIANFVGYARNNIVDSLTYTQIILNGSAVNTVAGHHYMSNAQVPMTPMGILRTATYLETTLNYASLGGYVTSGSSTWTASTLSSFMVNGVMG